MSIFDWLSGLITDSLLCTRSNFRDYPITACVLTNKGVSLPFANWNKEWCQRSKERPITENYWIEELKNRICGLPWAARGFPLISSEYRWLWRFPPDNNQLARVGELGCPKSLRKEILREHAAPLQFISCIRAAHEQSFSSPAVKQCCVAAVSVTSLSFNESVCNCGFMYGNFMADSTWAITSVIGRLNCISWLFFLGNSVPCGCYWFTNKPITLAYLLLI